MDGRITGRPPNRTNRSDAFDVPVGIVVHFRGSGRQVERTTAVRRRAPRQAASVSSCIGSTIEGSSFFGLLTLVDIGHIRISSVGNGRIGSAGSGKPAGVQSRYQVPAAIRLIASR
jgi:hypothetical protein